MSSRLAAVKFSRDVRAGQNAESFTIDDEGIVANSRGEEIARVIELTIDVSAVRLMGGGGHGPAVKLDPSQSASGTQGKEDSGTKGQRVTHGRHCTCTACAREDWTQPHLGSCGMHGPSCLPRYAPLGAPGDVVERNPDTAIVWAHYEEVIPGGERFTLEAKRRRIIANALKVRPLAQVLRAIDGLAASPHHNGQNDRRKKYLGIHYALQGQRGESNDERIDKMAAIAEDRTTQVAAGMSPIPSDVPSEQREMVRQRQSHVEAWLRNPGDESMRERGERAANWLHDTLGLYCECEALDGVLRWRTVEA